VINVVVAAAAAAIWLAAFGEEMDKCR